MQTRSSRIYYTLELVAKLSVCSLLMTLISTASVLAQDQSSGASKDINLEATDPLASFKQIQFRTIFNTSRWQTDDTTTDYEFRVIYPFRAWNRPNILRIIAPFSSEPEGTSALKDIEILDVATFQYDWGQAGFGLVTTISTNDEPGKSDFSLGPVLGFVAKPTERFQWGFINKNFLTGKPTLSTVQPVLTYALPDEWDIGLSTMQFGYDWREGEWDTLPLGFSVGKVFDAGGQRMRIFMEGEYNFRDSPGASKFSVLLGLSLLAAP